MKKFYLPLLCLGLLSSALYSQNTYVTGNAKVKVQTGTLFFHGGNFNVTSAVTANRTIVNDGNIKINGAFTNAVADGKNFVSTYNESNDTYGQVIIRQNNPAAVSGTLNRLTMEKRAINPGQFSWGQFAIPYVFSNAGQAHTALFGGTPYQQSSRYNASIMKWDNTQLPEYDHRYSAGDIFPTDYVILNLSNDNGLKEFMDGGQGVRPYSGTPANGTYDVVFRPAIYPTSAWSTWRTQRNSHREQYNTYIEEHIRPINSTNHGRYYFQFGNPYTSNIDLSRIGISGDADNVYIQDLAGVVKITSMSWTNNVGVDVSNVGKVRATWNGTTWAGNSNALIVRPFEGFYIALNDSPNLSDRTFNFNDGLKTFSNTAANVGDATSNGKLANDDEFFGMSSDESQAEDRALSQSLSSMSVFSSRTAFYQLGLNLYTEDDVETDNKVYVVIDSKTQTGLASPLESDYDDFRQGFFLTQENADGSEITSPNRTMQINAVNPRYVSKPIQLFFKTVPNDQSAYYLKADLFYMNIFNKLKMEDVNYSNGNSFFFYDKAQDVLLPITTDFSYYIERPEEVLNSRYVVYWNGGPEANSSKMEVSDELAGKTEVYKDGEKHKIRFNESWSSADIAVYDLAGRSIFKKDNVKTDVDYVLDLPNTMVYVVKIQSNTGEVVTQKILR